jgi:hypothetical protein
MYGMTIKQLEKKYREILAEFNRAVKRRRVDLQRAMRNHVTLRRRLGDLNASSKASRRGAARVYDAQYRSVMNKVTDPKCKPWTKRLGKWGCNGCERPRCRA